MLLCLFFIFYSDNNNINKNHVLPFISKKPLNWCINGKLLDLVKKNESLMKVQSHKKKTINVVNIQLISTNNNSKK